MDQQFSQALLHGYESVRPLTSGENAALPQALKYVAGACILWYMNNGFEESASNMTQRVAGLK